MSRALKRSRSVVCGIAFRPLLIAGFLTSLTLQGARADGTVGGLLSNRAGIDAVQRGCKVNAPWATPELCKAAAEAIRRRFQGEGVPYTPHRVDHFPSQTPPRGHVAPAASAAPRAP